MQSFDGKSVFFGALLSGSVLAGAWVISSASASGIPTRDVLTYSGVLEESGVPVDGQRPLRIELYNAETGGTPLCFARSATATLERGRFRLPLPGCTDAIRAEPEVWVEVQVNGVPIPRQKIGAVPYAVEAESALNADRARRAASVDPGSVGSAELADNAVTTARLAPQAVDGPRIAAGAIDGSKIAADAVNGSKIAAGAVEASDIAPEAVGTAQLANAAVDGTKIAPGAVGTAQLSNAAVDGPKIAPLAIDSSKLAPGSVGAPQLANGAVDGSRIARDVQLQGNVVVTGSMVATPALGMAVRRSTSCTNNPGLFIDCACAANEVAVGGGGGGTGALLDESRPIDVRTWRVGCTQLVGGTNFVRVFCASPSVLCMRVSP